MGGAKGHIGIALSAMVPLWQDKVRHYNAATRLARARAAGEILACYGDVLQFRAKARKAGGAAHRDLIDAWLGETGDYHDLQPSPTAGEVINALAEGIACALHEGDCDAETMELRRRYVWGIFDEA